MQNKNESGKIGEEIAGLFLLKNGFKILHRNYKRGFDEIDLIAKAPDGTLIFFEVKTLVDTGYFKDGLMPEDNLTQNKIRKISRACKSFAFTNGHLIDERIGWRIDLIAIILNGNRAIDIRHYENVA